MNEKAFFEFLTIIIFIGSIGLVGYGIGTSDTRLGLAGIGMFIALLTGMKWQEFLK